MSMSFVMSKICNKVSTETLKHKKDNFIVDITIIYKYHKYVNPLFKYESTQTY